MIKVLEIEKIGDQEGQNTVFPRYLFKASKNIMGKIFEATYEIEISYGLDEAFLEARENINKNFQELENKIKAKIKEEN